jgi:hypothetical protein
MKFFSPDLTVNCRRARFRQHHALNFFCGLQSIFDSQGTPIFISHVARRHGKPDVHINPLDFPFSHRPLSVAQAHPLTGDLSIDPGSRGIQDAGADLQRPARKIKSFRIFGH